MKLATRFAVDRSGATAIEYGLIAGLIAVAIIVSMNLVGSGLTARFAQLGSNLT